MLSASLIKTFPSFLPLEQSACILFCFCSKDVRLPVQLQRAMAAEAEAAREAKAKVIWCLFPVSGQVRSGQVRVFNVHIQSKLL